MDIGIKEAIQHFFPNPSFEMIYLEAVANALDAGAQNITISISLTSFNQSDSLEILIQDDGEGFTNSNFTKISSLLKKADKSHKGLGRLVYLHYFNDVEVSSIYDKTKKRIFQFNSQFKGDCEEEELEKDTKNCTRLKFSSFANKDLKSYDNVRASSVKKTLLKQFLPRFFAMKESDTPFHITIDTDVSQENREKQFFSDTQTIQIDDLPNLKEKIILESNIDLFNPSFRILYNVKEDYHEGISTSICVDNRAIDIPLLKNERIPERLGGVFLLLSDFLELKTDDCRQDLKLDWQERKVIERVFLDGISEILNEEYPDIKRENEKASQKLSLHYPHLEGYFSTKSVALIDENKTLEDAQAKFFKEQKEILGASNLSDQQYELSLNHATRILTEYILYRNIIIDNLEKITSSDKESVIHNLIVPMKKTLSVGSFIQDLYTNNAWILDDKYMSYQYILSDKNIRELIEVISDETELKSEDLRPDIALVFSEDIDTVSHPVDVVVVELKKKNLDYLDNMRVVEQLKQRARRLLEFYPNKIQRMFFFGIVEFDDELRVELDEGWTPLYSNGEAYYKTTEMRAMAKNKQLVGEKKPVSFTLMSFDALCEDAKARNETFLRILRDSIKKFSHTTNE